MLRPPPRIPAIDAGRVTSEAGGQVAPLRSLGPVESAPMRPLSHPISSSRYSLLLGPQQGSSKEGGGADGAVRRVTECGQAPDPGAWRRPDLLFLGSPRGCGAHR